MQLPVRWPVAISFGLILCLPAVGMAQLDPRSPAHPLRDLAFLEGSWAGKIDGTIGSSAAERQYRFIIGSRFLLMMHDRDPQEPGPKSDDHEEWSIFSFDPEREVIVLREFVVEGFVTRYTCEINAGPTSLMCESEASEGGSELDLRLRYEFADRDRFTETFEIFGPDGAMQVRIKGEWLRGSE